MKAYVGVTDDEWASFLRADPAITEANFWRPSGHGFKVLRVGEPFLFKTKAHRGNKLIGGGFFSGTDTMRVSEAWAFFGFGNGAPTIDHLRNLIARNRSAPSDQSDPEITCIMLRDLFFAEPGAELPAPPDFASPIVSGKGYDLATASGAYVADALAHLCGSAPIDLGWPDVELETRGLARLVVPRMGQQAFKALVLTRYNRNCAITGNKIAPVLEAAHILPVAAGGQHRINNGVLLRADVHKLFDDGYLGIDDTYRLRVSPRLRADFGNGDEFYSRQGAPVQLPTRRADRPAKDAVTWHMDTVFKAS